MAWAVARVIRTREVAFANHMGSGAYVPMMAYMHRPRRMRHPIECSRPAFPSYVFVAAEPGIYEYARRVSMFLDWLRVGRDIAHLTDGVVEKIRRDEMAQEFDEHGIRVGDHVIIQSPLMAGTKGMVTRTDGKGHVSVDVGPIVVGVPVDQLEVVNA
jgi:transcription antitermination factor NusG